MDTKFVITKIKGILVGCTIENGTPGDIRCYEDDSLIGNIYVAKVSNIVKNINAAFVDIKKGVSCYLPLEEYNGEKTLKVGHEIIVQVTRDGMKTKQPTVTTNISLNGEYTVVRCCGSVGVSAKVKGEKLRERLKEIAKCALDDASANGLNNDLKYGVVFRTKAADLFLNEFNEADEKKYEEVLYNDIMETLKSLDNMLDRAKYMTLYSVISTSKAYIKDLAGMRGNVTVITDDREIYDDILDQNIISDIKLYNDEMISLDSFYGISRTIEKSLQRKVYLKSGGYLFIENTEAMTVIDVNSGKAINSRNKEDEFYKINMEAVYEIGKQLKLRNLSGIIIVDFISMAIAQNENKVINELKYVTSLDYVGVNIYDMTRLGLVEMTRKKIRRPLHEVFIQFGS